MRRAVPFVPVPAALVLGALALCAATACAPDPGEDAAAEAADAAPEASDLWTVELAADGDAGALRARGLRRLTDREGYDNQPRFLPGDEAFLYTSIEEGNADVWRRDLAADAPVRLTATEDREYSPTPLPGGEGFSAVRIEVQHDDDQRLWRFDADGANPELLLRWDNDVFQVGYYEWVTAEFVGLVLVHEPVPILGLAYLPKQMVPAEPTDVNVGRCLRTVPGSAALDGDDLHDAMAEQRNEGELGPGPWLAYVAKGAGENPGPRTLGDYDLPGEGWWLRYLAVMDGSSETVVRMPDGVEDFAFLPDGGVLVGDRAGRLLHWAGRDSGASEWREVADLSGEGVRGITRIDVDGRGGRAVFAARR